jgi:hypothetical protein
VDDAPAARSICSERDEARTVELMTRQAQRSAKGAGELFQFRLRRAVWVWCDADLSENDHRGWTARARGSLSFTTSKGRLERRGILRSFLVRCSI